MRPLARIGAAAMLAQVVAAGCGAKETPVSDAAADSSRVGHDGATSSDRATAAAPDLAPAPVAEGARDGAALAPDLPAADGATDVRGGRIPSPPPGVPPCAPDSMAGHGNPCPYPVVVACTPSADARPSYVCYCFAPPSTGKWFCQNEDNDGGVTTAGGAR